GGATACQRRCYRLSVWQTDTARRCYRLAFHALGGATAQPAGWVWAKNFWPNLVQIKAQWPLL
ncbi:unnamed protein product, partial [Musa textilis]